MTDKKYIQTATSEHATPGRLAADSVDSRYYGVLKDNLEDVLHSGRIKLTPVDMLTVLNKAGLLHTFLLNVDQLEIGLIDGLHALYDHLSENFTTLPAYDDINQAGLLQTADFLKAVVSGNAEVKVQQEENLSPRDQQRVSEMADALFCYAVIGNVKRNPAQLLQWSRKLSPDPTNFLYKKTIDTAVLERRFQEHCVSSEATGEALKNLSYYASYAENAERCIKYLRNAVSEAEARDKQSPALSNEGKIDLAAAKQRLEPAFRHFSAIASRCI